MCAIQLHSLACERPISGYLDFCLRAQDIHVLPSAVLKVDVRCDTSHASGRIASWLPRTLHAVLQGPIRDSKSPQQPQSIKRAIVPRSLPTFQAGLPRLLGVQNGTVFASLLAYVELGGGDLRNLIRMSTESTVYLCARFHVKTGSE
jgi:hypothetical protein